MVKTYVEYCPNFRLNWLCKVKTISIK